MINENNYIALILTKIHEDVKTNIYEEINESELFANEDETANSQINNKNEDNCSNISESIFSNTDLMYHNVTNLF